jgi:hypothetical protein
MVAATPIHKVKRILEVFPSFGSHPVTWQPYSPPFHLPVAALQFYILLDAMREALHKNFPSSLLNSPEFQALQQKPDMTPAQQDHISSIVGEV